ncbi:ATP-binding protein [Clostridium sp.]|uniref:ATP-binding protein n=1 Tax=Clostridium sp. TaxID=1506 RepID=UPI00283C3EDF|nr:ATP-binding protein [Clostridium sp.]MDR3594168.1 ATP-binding protein [Clostridium sp.]
MGINDYFTKEYSVKSLIEGTTIENAICFLIDNSLDAAEKANKSINIEIVLDNNTFRIQDNGIGISYKEAQESLLKIGEKNSFTDLYGQGLKKAILTMGKKINIKSTRGTGVTNINLRILGDDEKDLWKPSLNYSRTKSKEGFIVEITEFTNEMNKFIMDNMNLNKFVKLKNKLSYKYRYILQSGLATIKFNEDYLDAKFIDADKVDEKSTIIDELNVTVKIFKNIKEKSLNGIDFIVNNRCVVEKEKSKKIDWNLKIRKKGHSYVKFFGEVIVETDDIEKLGVSPSKNKINFTTTQFQKILDYMFSAIEENRLAYTKPTISVQFDIEVEDYIEWKEILEEQGSKFECAKEVIEHLYQLGVNKIRANKD